MPTARTTLVAACVMASACAGTATSVRTTDDFPPLGAEARACTPEGVEGIASRLQEELPRAVAQVTALHGRPFTSPVRVDVCGDLRSFARYSPTLRAVGIMDGSGVILSPRVQERPEQIRGIVVHELSHLHLAQHLGFERAGELPLWFREGLAVYVSGGAGAERVSEPEAEYAILNGNCIPLESERKLAFSWDNTDANLSPHMFYRQAGMFVAFMVDSDREAFPRFLGHILDGRDFNDEFQKTYHALPDEFFREFARAIERSDR